MTAKGSRNSKGRVPDGVVVTSCSGGLASSRHGEPGGVGMSPVHRMTDMATGSSRDTGYPRRRHR